MSQEFSSKIDPWLLLVLMLVVVISIVSAIAFIRSKRGLIVYCSATILILACAVLPIWLLLDTKYTVADDVLTIRSGPRAWSIPISSIVSIEETRDSRSSPALSLDRFIIHHGSGGTVMISPKDKAGFLQAIGQEK